MKNSTYIFLLAIAFLTVSCEKQIDFRGDEQSPMVVVVSEPQPDTNLAVRLTYSRFFLSGGNFRVISNADVKVTVNGTTYTGVFNDSVYIFPYSPAEGDSINLTVRMQNGGEDTVVKAATRMPFRPSVTVRESTRPVEAYAAKPSISPVFRAEPVVLVTEKVTMTLSLGWMAAPS